MQSQRADAGTSRDMKHDGMMGRGMMGRPMTQGGVTSMMNVQRLGVLRRAGRSLHVVAGCIMVLFGVAMITGQVTAFSYWLLEKFAVLGRIG